MASALASRAMRRVLIDYANQRNTAKARRGRQQLSFDEELAAPEAPPEARRAAQSR